MAQAKKTEKIEAEPKAEASKGTLGHMVKFKEAVNLSDDNTPVTFARSPKQIIKLLPNGWVTVQKTKDSTPTLVPAGNILYFIPEK